MPHTRIRYSEELLKRTLKFAPIVGVFGQRQVGKTTLIEKYSKEYRTLDQESTLLELESNPESFISNRSKPFAIDEAQYAPRLFPALKEHVRKDKSVGQFLLSGSVRFTSRKAIRESLTGRITGIEILPFTYREAHELPLSTLLTRIHRSKNQKDLDSCFTESKISGSKDFESFLEKGGLPGISFFREKSVRVDKWQTHLDTLLNRDIRLIQNTSLPYISIRDLLVFLARNQGLPFKVNEAVRATQISSVTIKRLLFTFEALFLVRPIRGFGDSLTPTYFLEDQGLATWLTGKNMESAGDIVRGLYTNLREQVVYRPEQNGRILQYRTKHGVEVPLVFEGESFRLGILPTLEKIVRKKTFTSALAFIQKNSRFRAIIAYAGDEPIFRTNSLVLIPYSWLMSG